MILLIDNYDSFVHNLARYVRELGYQTHVRRNDEITLDEVESFSPSHIILSPGPCAPDSAGICLALIQHFTGKIPILGVCLGHQAIGQAFGGEIVRAKRPTHGKVSWIHHTQSDIFKTLSVPFQAARYHSLAIKRESLPALLHMTAETEEGEIMGIRHIKHPTFGVQFHPESILTEDGHRLLANFLEISIYEEPTLALM